MPRSVGVGLSLRIFGAENTKGRITQWRATTRERINAVLAENAEPAVEMMRDQMRAAYPWGRKTAESLQADVYESYTGPTVKISVNNYREVKYLTTLLPDSDFRPGPYPIVPSQKERLVFYWQRLGRWVALKHVEHPGFPQGDVLRRSGEQALAWLGRSVEQEVSTAVAELNSGGRLYSVSRRR